MQKTFTYRSLIISINEHRDAHSKESEFYWKVKRQDGSLEEEGDLGSDNEQEAIDEAKTFIDSRYES